MPDVNEETRSARRAESNGDLRQALDHYRRALRLHRGGSGPGRPEASLHLRMAEIHLRLDHSEDARERFLQFVNAAAAAGAVDKLAQAGRTFLEKWPDQDVCLELARTLDDADRTETAVQLLRHTWEERSGRRMPAGQIEQLARQLDPSVDLRSWTPRWPGRGTDHREPHRGGHAPTPGDRPVVAASGFAEKSPSPSPPATPPGAGGDPDDSSRPARGGGSAPGGPDEGSPKDEAGNAEVQRHFVRSYPDRVAHALGAVAEAGRRPVRLRSSGDGAPAPANIPDHPSPAPRSEDAPETPEGTGREPTGPAGDHAVTEGSHELREGLRLLEDLLELAPRDPELLRRRVEYARRMGEPGDLVEALLALADGLRREGSFRGAHFLADEVLRRFDSGHEEASALLRRIRGEWRLTGRAAAPPTPGAPGELTVRSWLNRALEDLPGELEPLYEAARAVWESPAGEGEETASDGGHAHLGRFLLARGRADPAAHHFEVVRRRGSLEPQDEMDVLYLEGLSHLRAGRTGPARHRLRRLAAEDDGFATAWRAISDGV